MDQKVVKWGPDLNEAIIVINIQSHKVFVKPCIMPLLPTYMTLLTYYLLDYKKRYPVSLSQRIKNPVCQIWTCNQELEQLKYNSCYDYHMRCNFPKLWSVWWAIGDCSKVDRVANSPFFARKCAKIVEAKGKKWLYHKNVPNVGGRLLRSGPFLSIVMHRIR